MNAAGGVETEIKLRSSKNTVQNLRNEVGFSQCLNNDSSESALEITWLPHYTHYYHFFQSQDTYVTYVHLKRPENLFARRLPVTRLDVANTFPGVGLGRVARVRLYEVLENGQIIFFANKNLGQTNVVPVEQKWQFEYECGRLKRRWDHYSIVSIKFKLDYCNKGTVLLRHMYGFILRITWHSLWFTDLLWFVRERRGRLQRRTCRTVVKGQHRAVCSYWCSWCSYYLYSNWKRMGRHHLWSIANVQKTNVFDDFEEMSHLKALKTEQFAKCQTSWQQERVAVATIDSMLWSEIPEQFRTLVSSAGRSPLF